MRWHPISFPARLAMAGALSPFIVALQFYIVRFLGASFEVTAWVLLVLNLGSVWLVARRWKDLRFSAGELTAFAIVFLFLAACVLIPWAIPAAVSGKVFQLIYNYNYGLANYLMNAMGVVDRPVNWLGTSAGAFLSLVMADAWKTTPFVAIILLAGLSGIPGHLYLQAQIDRAGFLRRFTRITLPLLSTVLLIALLFRTIDALRVFDLMFVLTGGGPGGSTTSLSLYGYNYFLGGDFGYGSAVSVVLFLIALGLSLLYIRAGRFARELS